MKKFHQSQLSSAALWIMCTCISSNMTMSGGKLRKFLSSEAYDDERKMKIFLPHFLSLPLTHSLTGDTYGRKKQRKKFNIPFWQQRWQECEISSEWDAQESWFKDYGEINIYIEILETLFATDLFDTNWTE